jgi:hypothetical protein
LGHLVLQKKELLDLCISNQLRILNGRVLGDIFGNYTCYTPNGASVVDYAAIKNIMFKLLSVFRRNRWIISNTDE